MESFARTTAFDSSRHATGSPNLRNCASRKDTFFAGAGTKLPMNRPCPVTYDTAMSLPASVSSACVLTCTLPHTTTWRIACIGTRVISLPSFLTTRCSRPLADEAPGLLEVQHRAVVGLRDDALQLRGRLRLFRFGRGRVADLVERLFGQAHRRERTAEAAVAQFRRERVRRRVQHLQFAAAGDRVARLLGAAPG